MHRMKAKITFCTYQVDMSIEKDRNIWDSAENCLRGDKGTRTHSPFKGIGGLSLSFKILV